MNGESIAREKYLVIKNCWIGKYALSEQVILEKLKDVVGSPRIENSEELSMGTTRASLSCAPRGHETGSPVRLPMTPGINYP